MPDSDARHPKVDAYVRKTGERQADLQTLRQIILRCGLTEEWKWGQPCYTLDGKNVLLLHGKMKDSHALAFFKGALLKDAKGWLVQPGPNTQSGRWMKFAAPGEVAAREGIIAAYIKEAIAVERAGLEVEYKETEDYPVPEELTAKMDGSPAFRHAFEGLTPGRQRGYLIHFAAAKQSKTRAARIEKWTPQILAGRGMHDY